MNKMAACLVLLAAATFADETPELASLADTMAGTFRSVESDALTDRRVRADLPALGEVVFYQQLNQGPEKSVYRQRLLVLAADGDDGAIRQTAYSFVDAGRWVDADAGQLTALTQADIERTLPDGCRMRWSATETGFAGHTDPATCRIISSRTGKPRRIEAESLLDGETLRLAERGFDDEGNQLFGTEPGDYLVLERIEP